ncbi:hypothetical protein BaRGS_00024718 [Batillaria attramentaria]|uniref:Uncharacterized protein n=1 Tax=Batillaria attramentaria TaxID=370345 RepID=A0ABD0KA75_9CAEN
MVRQTASTSRKVFDVRQTASTSRKVFDVRQTASTSRKRAYESDNNSVVRSDNPHLRDIESARQTSRNDGTYSRNTTLERDSRAWDRDDRAKESDYERNVQRHQYSGSRLDGSRSGRTWEGQGQRDIPDAVSGYHYRSQYPVDSQQQNEHQAYRPASRLQYDGQQTERYQHQDPPPPYTPTPQHQQQPHYREPPPQYHTTPPQDRKTPPRHQGTPPSHQGTPPRNQGTSTQNQGTPPRHLTTPPRRLGLGPSPSHQGDARYSHGLLSVHTREQSEGSSSQASAFGHNRSARPSPSVSDRSANRGRGGHPNADTASQFLRAPVYNPELTLIPSRTVYCVPHGRFIKRKCPGETVPGNPELCTKLGYLHVLSTVYHMEGSSRGNVLEKRFLATLNCAQNFDTFTYCLLCTTWKVHQEEMSWRNGSWQP